MPVLGFCWHAVRFLSDKVADVVLEVTLDAAFSLSNPLWLPAILCSFLIITVIWIMVNAVYFIGFAVFLASPIGYTAALYVMLCLAGRVVT